MEMYEMEILMAEDNARDRDLAIRALKRHNLANKLMIVRDGVEALDFLFARGAFEGRRGQPLPKVMFLDLKMPKVDGLEVLREVRAHPTTQALPVVVMTSSQEEKDVIDAYHLGVNSYVVKPMDFEQFAKVIADLGYYWVFTNHPPPSCLTNNNIEE